MAQLIHGGDIYTAREEQGIPIVDFSANINPLGMPEGAKRAVAEAAEVCDCYPDPLCRELRAAIAEDEGVPADWIVCGNGAADLIFRLVFGWKPKKALVLSPTFAEYEQALRAGDCQVAHFSLQRENGFLLTDALTDALDASLDLLILCNPNNPTGQPADRDLMLRILKRCEELGILLVADECFNDFLEEPETYSIKDALNGSGSLLILKAFTKIYGMAGIRLGYALCSDERLRKKLERTSQPWSVSTVAQAAGLAALADRDYRERTRILIREERAFLKEGLARFQAISGLNVIGSQANYIFFRAPGFPDLKERLVRKGVLIRSCGNYRGLDREDYRIAVKNREDNEILLRELEAVLREGSHVNRDGKEF